MICSKNEFYEIFKHINKNTKSLYHAKTDGSIFPKESEKITFLSKIRISTIIDIIVQKNHPILNNDEYRYSLADFIIHNDADQKFTKICISDSVDELYQILSDQLNDVDRWSTDLSVQNN